MKPLQSTAASAIASKIGFLRMPRVPGVYTVFARPCGANVAVRLTSEVRSDLVRSAKEQILTFDLELFLFEETRMKNETQRFV